MAEASLTLPVERKYCASAITNSCAGTSFTVRGAFGMLLMRSCVCRRRRKRATGSGWYEVKYFASTALRGFLVFNLFRLFSVLLKELFRVAIFTVYSISVSPHLHVTQNSK